jgi:hypothetical protein
MRRLLPLIAVICLTALPSQALADHDKGYQFGEVDSPTFSPAMKNLRIPDFVGGPCTGEAARSMPAADGHAHLDVTRHSFACRMSKVWFDPLTDVLAGRPDALLGEMDVKGDLMAIGVAYPESGFLLYDISDPGRPKFLSWYRGEECEKLAIDVDCGAYVDISPTGKRVYISVQQTTVAAAPDPQQRPLPAYPGVEVVDISVPTLPVAIQAMPVQSTGGVHTTKSFLVPAEGGAGPREPGEYTVSVANGTGLVFHQVLPTGHLLPVKTLSIPETHDTFVQDDPITGRTLLYAAGGFDLGFYVWDVTAPSNPVALGEWDLTPECGNDWYSHTIDVTVRNGRRILTMPVELIDFFGTQDDENCGRFAGNGDFAGPMWFVDVTDFSKLPQAGASDEEVKAKSEALLISTWSNAARRAGGELTFSPHNQQIVGDKVYLSQYHGGVVVLDATEAFKGRNVRPREIGLFVPHEGPQRPIPPDAGGILVGYHFVTGFIDYRPLVWDMTFAKGHVYVPDMTGGLTVVREDSLDIPPVGSAAPTQTAGGAACTASLRVVRASLTRRGIRLSGKSACAGNRIQVAIARVTGGRCAFLTGKRFAKAGSCARPRFLAARGAARWTLTSRAKVSRGTYRVVVRGAGRTVRRTVRVR